MLTIKPEKPILFIGNIIVRNGVRYTLKEMIGRDNYSKNLSSKDFLGRFIRENGTRIYELYNLGGILYFTYWSFAGTTFYLFNSSGLTGQDEHKETNTILNKLGLQRDRNGRLGKKE